MTEAPVEAKVWAATLGAGGGAIMAEFVLWILNGWVPVPPAVSALITLAISATFAFVAGWEAKHTPRGGTT